MSHRSLAKDAFERAIRDLLFNQRSPHPDGFSTAELFEKLVANIGGAARQSQQERADKISAINWYCRKLESEGRIIGTLPALVLETPGPFAALLDKLGIFNTKTGFDYDQFYAQSVQPFETKRR